VNNGEVYQPIKTGHRFFYGYIVAVAAFFIFMFSFGLTFSYGVFFKPLIAEFGWTRAMTSTAFSLNNIISGVLSIVMGGLVDRFGPRLVMTLCGLLIGLGYLLMSLTVSFWQINLFFGVIGGIGMGGVWVALMPTISRWFVKRRGLMTGIVISGTGFGQLIAPPVLARLIAIHDWRIAYIILGVAVLIVLVVAAQFLRRDPNQMGLLPYGSNTEVKPESEFETRALSLREAISTTQFWLIFLMYFSFAFLMFAFMVHIVPHATDLGFSSIRAANILAIIGVISILGNLSLGAIGDRLGNRQVFIIGFTLITATMFWLVLAEELWTLYLLALFFGFAEGGVGACEVPLTASIFGLRSLGLIAGFFAFAITIGAAVGPLVTGHLFDVTSSYEVAFLVSAAFGVVGLILTVILRPIKKLDT
jgi:MFS family permease